MIYSIYILFFVIYFSYCEYIDGAWDVHVDNLDTPGEQIILTKGFFMKIKLKITSAKEEEEKSIFHQSDVIQLNIPISFFFIAYQKNTEINTYKSKEYDAYLGISLNTD